MLLYIHVPFCQQKCAYCAFYSLPLSKGSKRPYPNQLGTKLDSTGQHSTGHRSSGQHSTDHFKVRQPHTAPDHADHPLIDQYCQTLLDEISLRAPGNRPSVSSVFFGGGTPSLLSSGQVGLILNTLQEHFSFSSTAEITMEANPESASRPNWLHEIRQEGVNRLSLGVQSLNDDELALLGRGHTAAEAEKSVNLAHQAHFSSISIDLMWGIPHRECCLEHYRPHGCASSRDSDHVHHYAHIPLHHQAHDQPHFCAPPSDSGMSKASIAPSPATPFSFTTHWLATLQSAIALSPHHISAYGLILEEGTPLAQQVDHQQTAAQATRQQPRQAPQQIVHNGNQRNGYASPLRLPTEEEETAMYREGITLLQQHGYTQYEISNYALPGHQCRHNLGYWQGQDYYGFGPAAVSTLQTARFANIADFHLWAEGIGQKIPAGEQEALTPLLLQEEKIMLSLRMTQGLAVEDWNTISSRPLHDIPLVQQLLTENLATFDTRHLALTPAGMMVSNVIISRLFENIPS